MSEHEAEPPLRPRPLDGIRIVECGIWHAGPGATAILGDLGAEVIKIESLSGDPERYHAGFGPLGSMTNGRPDWNLMFEFSNRNKRGISIDTNTTDGKAILHRLIESADVFVTNLRAATKPKAGIDYASLSKINPNIIHVNVSGFGPEGPMKDVGGFDPMGQAISGMIFLTGQENPVLLQELILDQMTAITASHAILTALLSRERQGRGQEVHLSLYGSALWLMNANVFATSVLQKNVQVRWERLKNPALRNNFKCQDGKWIMSANHPEHKYWPIFCVAVGRPDLMDDPRFLTPALRRINIGELILLLDAVFAARSRQEWLGILLQAGLNFTPMNDLTDVIDDPQALINGYITDYDHPSLGLIRMPGYPISFGGNIAGAHSAAPGLGEHTASVLAEMGYDSAEISRLVQENIIRI